MTKNDFRVKHGMTGEDCFAALGMSIQNFRFWLYRLFVFELGDGHKGDGFYSQYISLSSWEKAVLGFTPQAFDQAMNSVISTLLLAVSQL